MPNYDFGCPNCEESYEKYLPFESEFKPKCEVCGTMLVKQFSAVPAHFKGGGWGGR